MESGALQKGKETKGKGKGKGDGKNAKDPKDKGKGVKGAGKAYRSSFQCDVCTHLNSLFLESSGFSPFLAVTFQQSACEFVLLRLVRCSLVIARAARKHSCIKKKEVCRKKKKDEEHAGKKPTAALQPSSEQSETTSTTNSSAVPVSSVSGASLPTS